MINEADTCSSGLGPSNCVKCNNIHTCVLGQKLSFDESIPITEKMLKHGWTPTVDELSSMTLEQLREVNEAFDTILSAEQTKKMRENSMLTAGSWDRERECWVTDTTTRTDAHMPTKSSLTAGKWNSVRKQWEV